MMTFDEPYYLLEDEGHAFGTPPTIDDFELLLARSIDLLAARPTGPVILGRSATTPPARRCDLARDAVGRRVTQM
jgi:hypothetical protein